MNETSASQPKWNKQLVLATILLILGAGAYWLEFKHRPKTEEAAENAKRLFNLKDVPVASMQFVNETRRLTLECTDLSQKFCRPGDNSKWQISEPIKVRADDGNVNSLLSGINNLTATDSIDLSGETPEKRQMLLKEYGLDPASRSAKGTRTLTVKAADQQEMEAFLGVNHPIGEGFFVLMAYNGKPDENKVYVVPTYFRGNFDHVLSYWRDKKLLSWGAHEIAGFTLEGTKSRTSGTKKDGLWTLQNLADKKETYPGDLENVDSLLSAAAFLSAKDFVSDDQNDAKSRAALAGAKVAVKLTLEKMGEKAPAVLKIYTKDKPKAVAYATLSTASPLFELETAAKDRLDKDLRDLRLAKLITSVERYTARHLEFSGKVIGPAPLKLENNLGKWTRLDKEPVDTDRVQNFMDRVSGNRIKDFITGTPPPGEAEGGLTMTLSTEDVPTKRKYVFWRANNNLYARDLLGKRNEVLLVDPATSEGLPWEINAFAPKAGAPAPTGKK